MLRPDDGDHSEIITLSLWDSRKASGHSLAMTFIKQSVDSCRRLPTATAPSYAHASPTARAVFPTPFPRGTRSCPRSAHETTGRGRERDQDAVPDVTRSKPTLVATNAWAATGDAHRRVEL